MYMESFDDEEKRKIDIAKKNMENSRVKAIKFKIQMERAL